MQHHFFCRFLIKKLFGQAGFMLVGWYSTLPHLHVTVVRNTLSPGVTSPKSSHDPGELGIIADGLSDSLLGLHLLYFFMKFYYIKRYLLLISYFCIMRCFSGFALVSFYVFLVSKMWFGVTVCYTKSICIS